MATHRRKVTEVTARRHDSDSVLTVMHDVKGQQTARKGDWLVGTERGQVEVIKATEFEREFEPIPEKKKG